MNKKLKIVPAILAQNGTDFKKRWQKIAPYFKYVQIDIMDGVLVKTKNNIRPSGVKALSKNHELEIHLMVKNVSQRILVWLQLKNVRKIIWHYEAETDSRAILDLNDYIKKQKIKTGLAINPGTPLSKIKNLIKYFDTIQIMGVHPGWEKQGFEKFVLKKIYSLRKKYPRLNIAVDGGVNALTAGAIKKAGANILGVGSYLQQTKNIRQAIKKLQNSLGARQNDSLTTD